MIKQAIIPLAGLGTRLLPLTSVIHDHYGDVLWQLNRKIQAKYFWESVLELEDAEEKMKKDILFKLLNGPNKI